MARNKDRLRRDSVRESLIAKGRSAAGLRKTGVADSSKGTR